MKTKLLLIVNVVFFLFCLSSLFCLIHKHKEMADENLIMKATRERLQEWGRNDFYTELSECCLLLLKNNHIDTCELKNIFVYDGLSLLETVDIDNSSVKHFYDIRDFDCVLSIKQLDVYFCFKDNELKEILTNYSFNEEYIESRLWKIAHDKRIRID